MQIRPVLRAIVLLATLSGAAAADIIVWRDNSGVSHYTNDISNVPSEYRGEAMTVAKDWARGHPKKEPQATVAAATPLDAVPAARNAYEAAYVAGFRAGSQGGMPTNAGSFAQDQDDEVETASTAGAGPTTALPGVIEGHRPRRTDHHEGARDSRPHNPAPAADSDSDP